LAEHSGLQRHGEMRFTVRRWLMSRADSAQLTSILADHWA
jgi:hypothetical protein